MKTLWKEHPVLVVLAGIGVVAIGWFAAQKLSTYFSDTPSISARPILKEAKVRRVVNGHYVKLENDEKLVYAGIRSPFEHEPMFAEAKKRNEAIVVDKQVKLEYDEDERDSDGRLLAYTFLGDGSLVNATLVREGLAFVRLTPRAKRYADALLAAQAEARLSKRGVWASMTDSTEALYIADTKYAEFHRPSCEQSKSISGSRRVELPKKVDFFERGFAPCPKCKP